jgi:hypothetical protein
MMSALALLISFALGLSIGLQIKRIADGLYTALQAVQKTHRQKNSGVVRPGLNEGIIPTPDAEHRSAVVRPRIPKEADPNETEAALNSVRNRTAPR